MLMKFVILASRPGSFGADEASNIAADEVSNLTMKLGSIGAES